MFNLNSLDKTEKYKDSYATFIRNNLNHYTLNLKTNITEAIDEAVKSGIQKDASYERVKFYLREIDYENLIIQGEALFDFVTRVIEGKEFDYFTTQLNESYFPFRITIDGPWKNYDTYHYKYYLSINIKLKDNLYDSIISWGSRNLCAICIENGYSTVSENDDVK